MSSEQVEVTMHGTLDATQRSILTTKLEHETGISSAWFEHGNSHHLLIQYQSNRFSHSTLLDTIKRLGFQGSIENN